MLFKNADLVRLKKDYPIDISEIISDAEIFETKCNITKDIDKSKESLLDAKGILENMFGNLMSNLYDSEILETQEEQLKYQILNENVSRCLGMLDLKEKSLILGQDERNVGVSNLSAFKTELSKIYFSIIINTLIKAKKEYIKVKDDKEIGKKKRAFFYILYQVMTVVCSSLYSQQRLLTSGISSSALGKISPTTSSWQRLYLQSILKEKILKEKEKKEGIDSDEEKILAELEESEEEESDENP